MEGYVEEIHYQKGPGQTAPDKKAYIFVVPGIGLPPPNEWHCAHQQPWLQTVAKELAHSGRECTVVAVYHNLKPGELGSWNDILRKGPEVLHLIERYQRQHGVSLFSSVFMYFEHRLTFPKTETNPFVVVCHSLGGVIVKQAIVHAHREDHKDFSSGLQGLVFLSTPHLPLDPSDEWRKPLGILLIEVKSYAENLSTEIDLQSIAQISDIFQDLTLSLPILSTWEARPTKLKGLLHWAQKKPVRRCVLVDRGISQMKTGHEMLLEIDADHKNVCAMDESSSCRQKLIRFLEGCFALANFQDARDFTEEASVVPPAVDLAILRHHTSFPLLSLALPSDSAARGSFFLAQRDGNRAIQSMPDISGSMKVRWEPQWPVLNVESGVLVGDFAGRSEVLEDIDAKLIETAVQGPPSHVVLHGVGGIGKTSTAAQYLHTRKDKFDALFWIRADDHNKMLNAFTCMAIMLNLLEFEQTRDKQLARKHVMDWLEDPHKTHDVSKRTPTSRARWLLVFDNVDDEKILEEYWPRRGGGAILITSRDPLMATKWRGQGPPPSIELPPFDQDQAIEFLNRIVPDAARFSHEGDAAKVVDRLDRMPFTIRHMGAIMHRRKLSFGEFLTIYSDEQCHQRLHDVSLENTSYEHSMSTVWALGELKPSTMGLMNVLSLLNPDHIAESLLLPDGPLDRLVGYPCDREDYYSARADLDKSSLIAIDRHQEELQLHRTVQDAVRARINSLNSKDVFAEAFENAAWLLLKAWPVEGRMWHYPIDHWQVCETLLPHIFQLHLHCKRKQGFPKIGVQTSALARVLTFAGWYCHERGDFYQAKGFFDTAEVLCEQVTPIEPDLQVDLWRCQGCVATETNRGDDCFSYCSKVLESVQKRIPQPHTVEDFDELSIAYNEMGVGLMMMGEIDQARKLLEIAKWHSERHLKQSDTATSAYMLASANLGLAHWLRKHFEDSTNVLLQALHVYERSFHRSDKRSFAPGRLMHAMGNVKVSQSLNNEGLDWHQRAFRHYTETLGQTHHRTADVAHRLAEHHLRDDRHEQAEEMINQALDVFESKECYAPEYMRTIYLKGQLYETLGRQQEGQQYLNKATLMYYTLKSAQRESLPDTGPGKEDMDASVTFWSR